MPRPYLVLFLLACAGCSSVPPLAHTHSSAEALGQAVLEALARGDRAALDNLALNEQEFRDHVWPDLPAAQPERRLPFSYVWGDLHQKSNVALAATLNTHGGRRYALSRVSFSGDTVYEHYKVFREATLHVRDEAGAEKALRVCGSLIEKDGAWKVFSYVIDDGGGCPTELVAPSSPRCPDRAALF